MTSRRSRDRREIILQVIFIFVLLALLAGILISEAMRTAISFHRESAQLLSVKQTVAGVGYVLRDETVLVSNDLGPIEYQLASGAPVAAGDTVATVYADGSGEGTREKAAAITEEIERLRALDSGEVPDYFGAYAALMQELSAGKLVTTDGAKGTVFDALALHAAQKADAAARAARIAELNAAFDELIKNDRNAKDTVLTEAGGTFYREVDGYEALFPTSAAATLTAGELKARLALSPDNTRAIGKVVDNGDWYLAVPVAADAAAGLAVGGTYRVAFTRAGALVELLLERISEADAAGEALLLLRANGAAYPADLSRRQEVVIETGTVTGICVPMAALCEENGELAVYVEKDGHATGRRVTPVLYRDGYFLAAAVADGGFLQAGEQVIVTQRRIYEGKAVK